MPYIKQEQRDNFHDTLIELAQTRDCCPLSAGDYTYLFYAAGLIFIGENKSYEHISSVIRCLTDAAYEIRRRKLNPHEDKKIIENGDIL